MAELEWDLAGERLFETGVSLGVLYLPNSHGAYTSGHAWNGLSTVTESPAGAESSAVYADNKKFQNLVSNEELGGTIEAYTYPVDFAVADGIVRARTGVSVSQQKRSRFGFSYVTIIGNDTVGNEWGYKLHLIWDAIAAPSERAYGTTSDSPEAMTFSWEFATTPVPIGLLGLNPTSSITLDSTKVDADNLENLQRILYGSADSEPYLPTPAEVLTIMLEGLTIDEVLVDGGTPTSPGKGVVDGGTPWSSGPGVLDGGVVSQNEAGLISEFIEGFVFYATEPVVVPQNVMNDPMTNDF